MGYFSNGSEGDSYQSQLCARCVHGKDGECPVWMAHELFNYDECNNPESILHMLIPMDAEGHNGQCKLFIEKHPDLFEQ